MASVDTSPLPYTRITGEAREARFRLLAEVSNTLIWVMGPDGRFHEPQPGLAAFTGLTDEQIAGDGWAHALHPDDVARVMREWSAFRASGQPTEIHYRMRRQDGEYRTMRARAIPFHDADGRVLEWVGANEDITDAELSKAAARERERRLQDFADALPHIAWESDETGAVIWLNSRFYEFTGLRDGEALIWSWTDRFHPDDVEGYLSAWRSVVASGTMFRQEARMRRFDGVMRWMRFMAEPRHDADGAVRRWYGTATDIEDSRQATERLHRFVATLSHELRNPLAPVRNGLHLLKATGLPAAAVATIEMAERQVGHMVRLIDDLMDFNRIERDKLVLRLEPCDLDTELRSAIESCRPALESGRHTLTLDLPETPLRVLADRTRLSQIFGNLLQNAASYSPEGASIRVRVAMQNGEAVVDVEDDGIGIEPVRLEEVFQFFTQLQTSGPSRGLGLGLGIARRLIEMHGGTLHAHSEGLGRGSRFTAALPLLAAAQPSSLADRAHPESGVDRPASRRVLIVDDNRDAADSLAMVTEILGHEVRAAYDGREAVAVGASFRPQIAIVDIGLPDTTGYELAPRLRAALHPSNLILVALTGWGQERDRQRSVEAGFDAHLVKPVEMEVYRKVLDSRDPAQGETR